MNPFSPDEKVRYARQTILHMIGEAGQMKLNEARVLLVGAGGLGSSPSIYLTAAGVGTIGLIDADTVSLTNLHRQVLHFTSDIDKPKVLSAKEKLKQLNPNVTIITHQTRLTAENALSILEEYDLVIDGTDNLPSRYLINDACFFLKKHFIFGGVHQFEGQLSIFGPNGPCYRCIFPELPPANEIPSCAEAGVLGVVPGIIGLMQANEAIKWICGIGETLLGRLIIFDALATQWRELKIKKDPDCPLCGKKPSIKKLEEYTWQCAEEAPAKNEISVKDLKKLMDKQSDVYLLDVREQIEWDVARIEGAHLIPLSILKGNFEEIPKDKTVYCFCKMGGRSAKAIEFLKTQGYSSLIKVTGGISAWSKEIDRKVPQY
jgi:sulfur-carrier protein adenylyltransferase/sulfurtransferase